MTTMLNLNSLRTASQDSMARLLSISRPGGIQLFFLEKANLGQMKSRNSLMPTRKLLMISTN